MNKLKKSVLISSFLTCAFCYTNAQEWNSSEGIPSQMSVTTIFVNNDELIAFGQKMWREENKFFSEPKSYVSKDNGETWSEYINIDPKISTANTLCISENRIITSGRKGETQLDWVGAVVYSDDNGEQWNEATGLPTDIAITNIKRINNDLFAFGQRQWREGMNFFSEPKAYISKDNGTSWEEFIKITPELSSVEAFSINNNRVMASGRHGAFQVDWKGALFYSDDNGNAWAKASGIPEDVAITQIQPYEDSIVAVGQREWRDGINFFSEPKSFISKDNGETWEEFIAMDPELTTSFSLCIRNGRIITSGRVDPSQMDQVGGVVYTDL